MASDTLPDVASDRDRRPDEEDADRDATALESTFALEPAARAGLPGPVYDVLRALSSLKITVTLFALGIFVVLAGTFAQARIGNWEAVDQYFRTFVAFVEFDHFAPKSFFPERPDEAITLKLGGRELAGFFFPGGWLIGACMLVNLLAAHALRFKVQAKGARLTAGLVVTAIGAGLVWLVVASGDNDEGLQAQMSRLLMDGLWYTFVAALAIGVAGAVYGCARLDRRTRGVEWWSSACVGTLFGAVLAFILLNWQEARLKPESMRILWQLVKASTASLVLLAGCILVFKKRGGIVMLHTGVGLLMLSELLVGMYAEEGQMTINEGETVNFAQDVRSVELAFVDPSGKEEFHVVVPESRLTGKGTIEVGELPLRIKPIEFLDNSKLRRLDPDERARLARDEEKDYRQAAAEYTVDAAKPNNGFKDKIDSAAVWVELQDDDGKSMGTWLFGQHLRDQPVVVDGKTYDVSLRFKRKYLPYSVHLIDAQRRNYVGTGQAKDYSSYVKMVDSETGFVRDDVRVWMNNPLRYRGQTLYQSGLDTTTVVDPATGRPVFEIVDGERRPKKVDYTVLQVVTNNGWMLPYVCCMIVVIGMGHQFGVTLLRFLGRRRRARLADPVPGSWLEWIPAAAVLLLAGTFVYGMARPAETKPDEMAVHEFGRLPVTSQGRVKPLDSLARNQLVVITDREGFRKFAADEAEEGKVYNDVRVAKKTTPAIVWLLDTITRTEQANDYPVFRIENLELLEDLKLPARPGFLRYSYDEIEPRMNVLVARVEKAKTKEEEDWTFDERKAIELYNNVQSYFAMQFAFRDVGNATAAGQTETEYIRQLLRAGESLGNLPLAVPTEGAEGQWESYAIAAARSWVRDYAREHGLDNVNEIAERIAADSRGDRDYEIAFEGVLERMAQIDVADTFAMFVMQQEPGIDFREARERALAGLEDPPAAIRPQVEKLLDNARTRLEADPDQVHQGAAMVIAEEVRKQIPEVLGDLDLDAADPAEFTALRDVFAAYRAGDVPGFETAIAEYGEVLHSAPRREYGPAKVRYESWFNGFAPFWVGQYLALVGFVLAMASWLGYERPLARSAFWLMVFTLLLGTYALVGRIYISGRPPVTNLYSSAVFIAWGCMLIGLVLEGIYRIGIGTAIAGAIGFLSLGIAHYLSRQGDTVAVMEAVLDTNIWLATHVVCVTMGYAVTFLAGFLGMAYLFFGVRGAPLLFALLFAIAAGVLFTGNMESGPRIGSVIALLSGMSLVYGIQVERGATPVRFDERFATTLTKMIYGTLCFALFFSFWGTVLGGLWADDSWGRFWGWDPKENGALIIVLWNALVLHARWDGMVKHRGLAILAVAGNVTTAWSWFGTNELRAGLHSYGFTEGVLMTLGVAVLAHLVIIAAASFVPQALWRRPARQGVV